MRITVLANPIAGAGRAIAAGRALLDALRAADHEADLVESRLDPPAQWLDPHLGPADLLVVVGGDGAVRMASESAARTQTPIYHVPRGTENLFAREFGMDRSPARLLSAIEHGAVRRVDTGVVNGHSFLLMVSMGFDAEVIHDLSSRRGGGITHLSYIRPILRQLWRWRPPPLTVEIDGERVVDGQPGTIVVANCRQYARRIDPALHASMTDGRLDVVFLPTRTRPQVISWAVTCRRRRQVSDGRVVYRLGRNVRVQTTVPRHFQLDGDPPRPQAPDDEVAVRALQVSLCPGALSVLVPPGDG